jgi:hypothetical protein
VGAFNWNADVSAPESSVKTTHVGSYLTYRVGALFRVCSLSLRAEYERFDVENADTVDMVSLGVTWTFL